MKITVLTVMVFVLLLSACRSPEPEATAMSEPSATTVPTNGEPEPESAEEISEGVVEAEMNDLGALTAHPWQWASFTSPVEQFDVETPDRYRVLFNQDGTIEIVADCNNGAGDFTEDAGVLTIAIGLATLADCTSGSLTNPFITNLSSAARYFFEAGNLYIDLMTDGGTMVLAPSDNTFMVATGHGDSADPLFMDGDLVAHPWQWISFTNPVEQFDVETPEVYLLQFNEDNTVNIVADCNNASGSFALTTGLSIEIEPMTMVACPPESLSDQFVAYLGSAAKYFYEDGNLHIDLMADGGTMTFAPASTAISEDSAAVELAGILGNLTYNGILPDDPITLTDGVGAYEEKSSGNPFVRLVDRLIATGDLNGDGTEDAAAFLVDNTTGSGDFVYLIVVLDVFTEPAPLKAFLIGDRTPVESLTIMRDLITTEIITHGSNDVMCCPTLRVRKGFGVENGRLAENNSEELGTASLADLNGTNWELVDFNLDQEPVSSETEITLSVNDGQISGFSGCNNYNSSIMPGEDDLAQSLTVGSIVATQMLCADELSNQETIYLDRLAKVVAWRYDFGYLSLTYRLDDDSLGELIFAPQES